MASLEEEATERELYVSPQIEELLGFSQTEWVENPILWYTQLHPEDRNRWHEEFARTCSEGRHFQSVYRFIARDGHVVWVHGEAQVVRDEAGRPQFLQGVAFDITGIKRAEEELRAMNQTLAERVAERTAELREQTVELERSNRALNEFTYVVTHDLREPLRTINSFIQKLVDHYSGQFDATAEDFIARTVNAGKRMGTLITDLLSYSRVGSEGKAPEPVECDKALQAALANLHASLDESGAAVTASELPVVQAAPSQLVQLFQNLVSNALKFRGEEPLRIHVSADRRGDEWEIGVADNGIGIEANSLERIFRLGVESRLHSRAKYPGHGIGLATCQKIVERHGGRIWATSDGPGKGTAIHFTLPGAE
jgi:PAS domain S-box-containing protein